MAPPARGNRAETREEGCVTGSAVRTGVNEEQFHEALALVAKALHEADVPHVFMGGVASMVFGRTSWTHDIDVFLGAADEPRALDALNEAGFEREPVELTWLSKVRFGDVVVDLIRCASGPVFFDEEMRERAVAATVWGTRVNVISAEDLVVTKALAHSEDTDHYWWDALAIVAGVDLDWEYLLMRARPGPRRVLSLLLYAQSMDLMVPDAVVRRLLDALFPPEPQEPRR
jgi:predicted nucleotidyltransferase